MHDESSPSHPEEQASAPLPSAQPGAGTPGAPQEQPAGDGEIQPSGSVPLFPQASQHAPFYTIGSGDADEASFAAPFQYSGAIPPQLGQAPDTGQATGAMTASPPVAPPQRSRRLRRLLWGLPLLVVALLLVGSIIGLAAPARSLQTSGAARPSASVRRPIPPVTPLPAPTHPTTGPASTWQLSQLPAGWTAANLSRGDAAFAMRTAMTFTDREMSLDARNMGTRAVHSGTLTSGTFLLTSAARVRFQQHDVRVESNVLFDRLTQEHLIQAVVDEQPQLIQFQAQGQQQFAWVDVTFHLWQSRFDPAHPGSRVEGLETDPATGQPRLHRMSVLLLRVDPARQGANAPMGGTGWLVSNYGLDLPGSTVVDLVLPA